MRKFDDRNTAIVRYHLYVPASQVQTARQFGLSPQRVWKILNTSPEYHEFWGFMRQRALQLPDEDDADHHPSPT